MVDFFITTYDDKDLVRTEKMFDFEKPGYEEEYPFDQEKFLNFLAIDTGNTSRNCDYSYVLNFINIDSQKKDQLYQIYQEANL